jgi:hypothetical protein
MIASSYGHESIVRLLLADYHANVNERNKYYRPLFVCCLQSPDAARHSDSLACRCLMPTAAAMVGMRCLTRLSEASSP